MENAIANLLGLEANKCTLFSCSPLIHGGLGGLKPAYTNDQTLQQNIRKVETARTSYKHDQS
jgi:hypothetical protein